MQFNENELKINNYYIHFEYGICKYIGTYQYHNKEYYNFLFAKGQKLLVGLNELHNKIRLADNQDEQQLSDVKNTKKWRKNRDKTLSELKESAKELAKMYVARKNIRGFKFNVDTEDQKKFESLYPYEFTDGQKNAIAEIKKDMESEKPMNALLEADVGAGKSTVAQVISFKAVMDKKQVIILAPTTILAKQHYNEMMEMVKDYDLNICLLDGDVTKANKQQIIKNIENDNIDIIIGTQTILANDIKFPKLALLIIDEEQRFGVVAKEQLKKFKVGLNVLMMTATPIPKSLSLGIANILHIVKMNAVPRGKKPIATEVSEYDEKIIKKYINRELARGGQCYFLYNNTVKIYDMKDELLKMMPELRIGLIHGKLKKDEINQVMTDFKAKRYDVLLTTTIVEIGITVKNANTIIINQANRFGLASLQQLRGRTGRNSEQGYCLLLHDKDKQLTSIAQKRLKAIKENNDMGANFKLAETDLQLRGSGLGLKQHGHISQIGMYFYHEILDQYVKEELENC